MALCRLRLCRVVGVVRGGPCAGWKAGDVALRGVLGRGGVRLRPKGRRLSEGAVQQLQGQAERLERELCGVGPARVDVRGEQRSHGLAESREARPGARQITSTRRDRAGLERAVHRLWGDSVTWIA